VLLPSRENQPSHAPREPGNSFHPILLPEYNSGETETASIIRSEKDRPKRITRRATMTELTETAPIEAPLTETQRVIDIFVAPSKTFTDIRRKATFWGPLAILIIVSIGFGFTVQQKVGWDRAFGNALHQTPRAEEKLDALPNAEAVKAGYAKFTAIRTYGFVVFVLIFTAIYVLVVWATINFGFGGTSKYGQIYAVSMYSGLVWNVKFVLAVIAIFAGLAPDSFLIDNPVGTNIGYYLSSDVPLWLRALCSYVDIFAIWSLALTIIGVSIVAKVSRGKAAGVVIGWWLLMILPFVGLAAMQS
jgi:hypothetical protein